MTNNCRMRYSNKKYFKNMARWLRRIYCGWLALNAFNCRAFGFTSYIVDFIYPTSWVDDPYTGIRYKLSSK